MENAALDQSNKDGMFTGSSVGRWLATFLLPTTAVHDRTNFQVLLQLAFIDRATVNGVGGGMTSVKHTTWYYSYDGDFITWTDNNSVFFSSYCN